MVRLKAENTRPADPARAFPGRAPAAALAAALLLFLGCAYFNTFYNARQSYDDALESVRLNPDNPSSSEEQKLRTAIEGAGKVLTYYPESRWADDAQLLIADALLLLGSRSISGSGTSNYEEAMRAYSSVMVMTEDNRMRDRASLGIGDAALALGRYPDAAAAYRAVSRERRDLFTSSRIRLVEALVLAGNLPHAAAVIDTLRNMDLSDSLEAEVLLAECGVLGGMGLPDSAASRAEQAGRLFRRGSGYYRAVTAAAEAYIEGGDPSRAVAVLEPLRASYSTRRELADIALLSARAAEAAGNNAGALSAYRDASELDSYREVGAEALYRRALLLERDGRLEEALDDLDRLSRRSGGYLWIRLASDRRNDIRLLSTYIDTLATAPREMRDLFSLLAAEKRIDLYGSDESAGAELRRLVASEDTRVGAMAMVILAENFVEDPDSAIALLGSALALSDSGDLAGRIEARLGLPPGPAAEARPSALLEEAWRLFDEGEYHSAWRAASSALASRWRLDREPALLWIAYLSSEAARMDDRMVEGYLSQLVGRYPGTAEGRAALDRMGGAVEDPEGE